MNELLNCSKTNATRDAFIKEHRNDAEVLFFWEDVAQNNDPSQEHLFLDGRVALAKKEWSKHVYRREHKHLFSFRPRHDAEKV